MAHIIIIGAGIGGLPMAFEMREIARPEDRVTVLANTKTFHFVPSNPWVAELAQARGGRTRDCSLACQPQDRL